MQFQSDILHCTIKIPKVQETTSLGVAYLAGLAIKFYSCLDEIENIHQYREEFLPKMSISEINRRYKGWKKRLLPIVFLNSLVEYIGISR